MFMQDRREQLRESYRPQRVRLLFVAESPPASGRFFYQRDSGLYRAMRDAFESTDAAFLDLFRDLGCYLIDLCADPVDHLEPAARRTSCAEGEAALARQIALLEPPIIATLLVSIEANVHRALATARWSGPPVLHLPYPGRWARHRRLFMERVRPAIGKLRA